MDTKTAAHGRWPEIYNHFGIQIIPNKHQECIICGKKGSSGLRVHDKMGHGDYICTCSNGTGLNLLIESTGLPFAEIAKQVDEIIGNKPDRMLKPKLKGIPKKNSKYIKAN